MMKLDEQVAVRTIESYKKCWNVIENTLKWSKTKQIHEVRNRSTQDQDGNLSSWVDQLEFIIQTSAVR